MHLDLGASQFVTKELQIGLVGYVFNQLSCDSGTGDRVGCFRVTRRRASARRWATSSRLAKTIQGYFNLKGYKEFAAEHRADGWNMWLTFVISPAAPTTSARPTARMITK